MYELMVATWRDRVLFIFYDFKVHSASVAYHHFSHEGLGFKVIKKNYRLAGTKHDWGFRV